MAMRAGRLQADAREVVNGGGARVKFLVAGRSPIVRNLDKTRQKR
jgi:hypothetical protein